MGDFKVAFSLNMPFGDPEYRSIYLDVTGDAEVSCADREGNENDVVFVQNLITDTLQDQIFKLDNGMTSYKELPSKNHVFGQEVAAALGTKNITLKSFAITSIAPDAKSQERISNLDKTKAFAAMSPAEQMKMMEEAGFQGVTRIALPADGRTAYLDCIMPQAWDTTGRSILRLLGDGIPEERRVLADSDEDPWDNEDDEDDKSDGNGTGV